MSENRCVCCGEIVPEGKMVCPDCEKKAEQERDLAEDLVSKWARGELVERKKGEWIPMYKHFSQLYTCSCCGEWRYHPEPFCGQCGADMRED